MRPKETAQELQGPLSEATNRERELTRQVGIPKLQPIKAPAVPLRIRSAALLTDPQIRGPGESRLLAMRLVPGLQAAERSLRRTDPASLRADRWRESCLRRSYPASFP